MKALLIVDLQNDFCPGGALPAPEGHEVVPVINKIMDDFELVIASKDWHPEETHHFERWPVHCVKHTYGAAFHPNLDAEKIDQVFLKGTGNKDDGYSAFEATNVNLPKFLKDRGVKDLYVCGLTTDYCVKASALDAKALDFNVFVIEDAIRAVNENKDDGERAIEEMKHKRIIFLQSSDV